MKPNQPNPNNYTKSQLRRQARKAAYTKKRDDMIQDAKAGLGDMNQAQVIGSFKNAQSQQHQAVLTALGKLQGQVGKLTQGKISAYAYNKAHVKGLKELKAELTKAGIDYKDIDDNILVDLVALDDWSAISKFAIPMITKYGLPILHDIYKSYVKPKVDKWMGGDEGLNPADWGNVLGPRRFTGIQGENIEYPGVKSVFNQITTYDTVDPRSLASVIAPEFFKHRYSFLNARKSALANVNAEYSITSSALGTIGVVLFARNPSAAGTTVNTTYATIFNSSDFSVLTGTQTAAATYIAGPLYGSINMIESGRLVNLSVQVIPTASFNTAGAFTLGFNPRVIQGNYSSTNIGSTLVQLKNFPFVTSFNNKTSARMINVTGDQSDDDMVLPNNWQGSQRFVLLGSGLPASTEVARLVISGTYEFQPQNDYLPVCVLDYPRVGPLTEMFETMMFTRYPVIQQLDLTDAKRVADGLPDGPVMFDRFMDLLGDLLSGVKPRQYISHIAGNHLELPGELSDLIIE